MCALRFHLVGDFIDGHRLLLNLETSLFTSGLVGTTENHIFQIGVDGVLCHFQHLNGTSSSIVC